MKKLLSVLGIAAFLGIYLLSSSVYAAKPKAGSETTKGKNAAEDGLPDKSESGAAPLASNQNLADNTNLSDIIAIPAEGLLTSLDIVSVTRAIENAINAGKVVVIVTNKGEELKDVEAKFESLKERVYFNLINVPLGDLNNLFEINAGDILKCTLDNVTDEALVQSITNI